MSTEREDLIEAIGISIISKRYGEDIWLPSERIICESYSVSRVTLREAYRSLVSKGMLSTENRKGTKIQPICNWNLFDVQILEWLFLKNFSHGLLYEITQLRMVFEPYFASLTAVRADVRSLESIERNYVSMKRAYSMSILEYIDEKTKYHHSIHRSCQNRPYQQFEILIRSAILAIDRISFRSEEDMGVQLTIYEKLTASILSRSPQLTSKNMKALINIDLVLIENSNNSIR